MMPCSVQLSVHQTMAEPIKKFILHQFVAYFVTY